MNSPATGGPKKFFVLTGSGETGPFAPSVLNRMFSKGEIQGTQMCRREDQSETHRLDEVFRHMGPSQAVVEVARKNVAAYNVASGTGSIKIGAVMLGGNLLALLAIQRISIPFIIVGIGLLVNGLAQRRRGEASRAALPSKPANESHAPASSPKASEYDY
jgi:hypothetical protein